MQQVDAMLSGLLLTAFKYETFAYREICRRFCRRKSENEDVKKFQKRCRQAGIHPRYLNVEDWLVEPVTPLGMGNPTIATAAAQRLQCRPVRFTRLRLNRRFCTSSPSPRPGTHAKRPGGRRWARRIRLPRVGSYVQGIFGTLMQGVPIRPKESLSPIEQLDAVIPLFAGRSPSSRNGTMLANPMKSLGFPRCANTWMGSFSAWPKIPEEKQRVKQYMDSIGKLWNQVEGLTPQRGQQAQQKAQGANGADPAAMAKVQSTMMLAKVKAQTSQQKAAMQERQNSQRFVQGQRREDAKAFAEIQRDQSKHNADMEHQRHESSMTAFEE